MENKIFNFFKQCLMAAKPTIERKCYIIQNVYLRISTQIVLKKLYWGSRFYILCGLCDEENSPYAIYCRNLATCKIVTLLNYGANISILITQINLHIEQLIVECEFFLNTELKHEYYNAYVNYRNNINVKDTWIKTFFFIEKEEDFDIVEFYQNIIGRITFYGKDDISLKKFYNNMLYIYPGTRLNAAVCLEDIEDLITIDYQGVFIYLQDLNENKGDFKGQDQDNKTYFICYDKEIFKVAFELFPDALKKTIKHLINSPDVLKKTIKHLIISEKEIRMGFVEPSSITYENIEAYRKLIERHYNEQKYKKYKELQ